MTTNQTMANTNLHPPTTDLGNFVTSFAGKGLSPTDLVVLTGAHTVGVAQCTNFRSRLYGESNINAPFAASLRASCPQAGGDTNLAPLDSTPNAFDNAFFTDLIAGRGLLHSDQELYRGDGSGTDALVRVYAANPARFNADFAAAMVRMGAIRPLTGTQGEIRLNCSRVN